MRSTDRVASKRGWPWLTAPPPEAGIAIDYLWREVCQRYNFLQILGHHLLPVKNHKARLVGWIHRRETTSWR